MGNVITWARGLFERSAPAEPSLPAAGPSPFAEVPAASPEVAAARVNLRDGLQNLMAGLGNERDKRSFTNYTFDFTSQSQAVLEAMYMSSWLADKIVSIPADDMTREWIELSWDGHDDDQDDDKAIQDVEEDLDVQGKTNLGIKWARLSGGGVIILGINNQALETPLNLETVQKDSLVSLVVKDRWNLTTSPERDQDPLSPNFGLPVYYQTLFSAQRIHWTRIIRFDGRELPERIFIANNYWHASELAHIIDNIKDYDAGRAGAASMLWEASGDILRMEGLALMLATADGRAKFRLRMMDTMVAKSMNKALVLDKLDEYAQKNTSFAGVRDVLGQFILDVSGAADIPVTRLFGQSPAGLTATGESDIRNYYDHIAASQKTRLRRQLFRLYQVLVRSAIGHMPENFGITFKPLWQVSAAEQATIRKTNADRDIAYIKEGVITEGLAARQLKADGVYSQMEDDDVKIAEELAQAALQLAEEQTKAAAALAARPPVAAPVTGTPAPGQGAGAAEAPTGAPARAAA